MLQEATDVCTVTDERRPESHLTACLHQGACSFVQCICLLICQRVEQRGQMQWQAILYGSKPALGRTKLGMFSETLCSVYIPHMNFLFTLMSTWFSVARKPIMLFARLNRSKNSAVSLLSATLQSIQVLPSYEYGIPTSRVTSALWNSQMLLPHLVTKP